MPAPLGASALASVASVFLDSLAARGRAPTTISTRASGLRTFVSWCEQHGIERPEQVTRADVEAYQRWLHAYRRDDGRPLSERGQCGRLVAVRVLFAWLARTDRVAANPAAGIELPRAAMRLPRAVLTIEQVERVLAEADIRTALGLRDRAILEALYSTGMRRSELTGVEVGDLDSARGLVVVRRAKGGRQRVVPIGARALAWIGRYLRVARPRLAIAGDAGPLFVTEVGERMSGARLTDVVRGYVERSGVGVTGACHLFRHTCATLMLEGGADIRHIQELLGHAHLSTTEIYTRVSIVALREVYRATHPARLDAAAAESVADVPQRIRAWRHRLGAAGTHTDSDTRE